MLAFDNRVLDPRFLRRSAVVGERCDVASAEYNSLGTLNKANPEKSMHSILFFQSRVGQMLLFALASFLKEESCPLDEDQV